MILIKQLVFKNEYGFIYSSFFFLFKLSESPTLLRGIENYILDIFFNNLILFFKKSDECIKHTTTT